MKRFTLMAVISLVLSFGSNCRAQQPLISEAPIASYGTPTTVPISTSTWTKIPTSQTAGRIGVFVSNPSTNNANMVAHIGNCTSTAIATTVRPIEFTKGNGFGFIPVRDDGCLWVLSLHTAAESVHYQDAKQ